MPLGTRVAWELEQLRQRSVHDADDDLVFGHPCTGEVLDHSQLTRRFKSALRAAGLREFRFNDLRHTFGTRMAGKGAPTRISKSGWDTAASAPRKSMPTTNRKRRERHRRRRLLLRVRRDHQASVPSGTNH